LFCASIVHTIDHVLRMGRCQTRPQPAQTRRGFGGCGGGLDDPAALTVEDDMAEGEMRCITLGRDVLGRVLYVVWTQRNEQTIRLISARKASPGEARQYRE